MTPDLATLRDLLARTQATTGPDRDLDCEFALHLGTMLGREKRWWGKLRHGTFPYFSADFGEAIRLTESALPGWDYSATKLGCTNVFTLHEAPENPDGGVTDPGSWSRQHHGGGATTMPLAILEAMLAALVSRVERQQRAAALSEMVASDAEMLP